MKKKKKIIGTLIDFLISTHLHPYLASCIHSAYQLLQPICKF